MLRVRFPNRQSNKCPVSWLPANCRVVPHNQVNREEKRFKATLAQLGERQTEVDSVNSSEGLVFDPQKSQIFLVHFCYLVVTCFRQCCRISQLIMHNYHKYVPVPTHADCSRPKTNIPLFLLAVDVITLLGYIQGLM